MIEICHIQTESIFIAKRDKMFFVQSYDIYLCFRTIDKISLHIRIDLFLRKFSGHISLKRIGNIRSDIFIR